MSGNVQVRSFERPIPPEDFARLQALCGKSLYLQAYELASRFGPFREWTGTAERILAGRLAWNLGARRLCNLLHLRAWREDPESREALVGAAHVVLARLGPLSAWEFLRAHEKEMEAPRTDILAPDRAGRPDEPGPRDSPASGSALHGSDEVRRPRAYWLAMRAHIAGLFRDFDTAESALALAEELRPNDPRLCVQRCFLLEMLDRYEELVLTARRSLEIAPGYAGGAQTLAHALTLVGRDDEALELLQETARTTEDASVLAQLAMLQSELGDPAGARASLERMALLLPMIERPFERWLAGRRSDAAYECGDVWEAIDFARRAGGPFFGVIAERLASESSRARRVRLEVGFVRQHHMTCAPATLTAVSRYWAKPADHLEIAERICYDGTPAHSERSWAEQSGWLVREFTVTWKSAAALLEGGIPFTLTTVAPRIGHLQAVVGYDARRGTLLVRDPYQRSLGEFLAPELLEQMKATGPRGMALVPGESASRLETVDLPDAADWDRLHEVQKALAAHDRAQAHEIYRTMSAANADHFLTLQARRCLAGYDADAAGMLACIDRMLELQPSDATLLLTRLSCLRQLGRRDERLEVLERICAPPDAHPVFLHMYASELAEDAREHARATRLLRRGIRRGLLDAGVFRIIAGILRRSDRSEEPLGLSLELLRFAACLEDKDEGHALAYFLAAWDAGRGKEVLAFLVGRAKRLGRRSARPVITAVSALAHVDLAERARELLEEALALRPEDGDLLLFAADTLGRHGEFECAAEMLGRAEGRSRRSDWLRTSASLASYRGELVHALSLWREVLSIEPLSLGVNREIARLLAATESRPAALEHLRAAVERFPHNSELQKLHIGWLREEGAGAAAETALRSLIETNPVDTWARRELALVLGDLRRFDEAFAEVEIASLLDPSDPWAWSIRGRLCALSGKSQEAKDACRRAIQLSVDTGPAINLLVAVCPSTEERREALAFVRGELLRQVSTGEGLLEWRERARSTLDPEELLAALRESRDATPDLWRAWSALIGQLTEMNRLDEALDLSGQATSRFPFEPRVWLDRGLVCQTCSDIEGETDALGRALRISPNWGSAVRRLAALHERAGRFDRSRALLEQTVAANPLDPVNHSWLADALWKLGEREPAVSRMEHALSLQPEMEWGWRMLAEWTDVLGAPDRVARFARELTAERPGVPQVWRALAGALNARQDAAERLAAIDRALALDPTSVATHDLRAEALAESERFEEALEACRPPALGAKPPLPLRGRAAWVEAVRGDLSSAIARMKEILDAEEKYYWGWARIAEWYRASGENDEYRRAAQKMASLAPQDPIALATLGHARLLNGDKRGAKDDFVRAIELSPDLASAAWSLLDLLIEDGELDEAEQLLARLHGHQTLPLLLSFEARLRVKRGEKAEAARALRELCFAPLREGAPLKAALDAFETRWPQDADEPLGGLLELPGIQPVAGRVWVDRQVGRGRWEKCADVTARLQAHGEIGRVATLELIQALTASKQRERLRAYVTEHEPYLRTETTLWGAIAYGYATLHLVSACAEWGRDWEQRQGLEPWMLSNLALAFRGIGKEAEAERVSRRALELRPDHTSVRHALWVAADEAARGEVQGARARLDGIDPARLPKFDAFLHRLARATVDIQTAPREQRREAFRRVRLVVREAEKQFPSFRSIPSLRLTFRRCIARIARARGGPIAALWQLGWVALS